jgi:DNA-binding NarL/FixJ family response regulator
MAYSILVVDEHPLVVASLVQPLKNAGYDVTGATTFEAAIHRLDAHPPNLLIAAERLGLFNGLHLVVRGRIEHPDMAAIVTAGEKDPVLEAEAKSYGAACVVSPRSPNEILSLVSQTFASKPM